MHLIATNFSISHFNKHSNSGFIITSVPLATDVISLLLPTVSECSFSNSPYMFILGLGVAEWFAIKKSQDHILSLKNKETTPPPLITLPTKPTTEKEEHAIGKKQEEIKTASPPQIVMPLGNLKQRAIALSNEIMGELYIRGIADDKQYDLHRGYRHPPAKGVQELMERDRNASFFFRFQFLGKVRNILIELARLNYKDPELDRFIESQDREEISNKQLTAIKGKQQAFPEISIHDMQMVAKRFKILAEQIQ